jgi:hypothetical protein
VSDLLVLISEGIQQLGPVRPVEHHHDLVGVGFDVEHGHQWPQLRPELPVRAGQQLAQSLTGHAVRALTVGEQGGEAAAAAAGPFPGVPSAGTADPRPVLIHAD